MVYKFRFQIIFAFLLVFTLGWLFLGTVTESSTQVLGEISVALNQAFK